MSGDVEINPGPLSVELSTSTESSMSYMDVSLFENNFSIVHYNVTSLLNKIEIELSHFDLIALSETWLSPRIHDDDIKQANYQDPYRKDRETDTYGGGVIVFVKENIPCKRRQDLEVHGLE